MKKFKTLEIKESMTLYIIMILGCGIVFYYHHILGAILFIISISVILTDVRLKNKIENEFIEELEHLNDRFDDITRGAIFSIPFPLVLTYENGEILWYNTYFKKLVDEEKELIQSPLQNLLPQITPASQTKSYVDVSVDHRHFRFFVNTFPGSRQDEGKIILYYGIDQTDFVELEQLYDEKSYAMVVLYIDNYDEVRETLEDGKRNLVFAEIDRLINEFWSQYSSYIRRYEEDKYVIFLEKQSLQEVILNKFRILDEVREARFGNTIPITLSIGASYLGNTPVEVHNAARTALDVALGRGGDQAVLKIGDDLSYFGGKNKAQEKRNRVKARVIAHALSQLMSQSSHVLIMGHKNPDMDSIGACLGIYEASKLLGVEANIVLNEITPAIENIYDALQQSEEDYSKTFIDSEEALRLCSSSSLVIVLDNHRKNSCECPELLDITDKIVLIDHHRRGQDYIKNTTLTYLEPYASSASEMVTEILFYLTDKLEIPTIVAEALLAGITVDTKNFFYQTGVRTFEAASILKRQGADSIRVKQLFKDDARTMMLKSEVISNMEIYNKNIAIGILDDQIDEAILIAAQAADDLLNILGIEASFVLTRSDGRIHISGRSLGKISVQLIMEKLGGGGHLTSAGTQISADMDEAKCLLKQAIDAYVEEEKNEIYID